eukprot:m.224565 g.224565  ORF g.224565 m.224565 type:complete len:208 (-) comp16498_c0_seq1:125-748(-)
MAARCVALLFVGLVACAAGISFHLPVSTRKCLQEDVHKDVLVVGNYEVEASDLTLITLDVTDSRGHPVYRKEDAVKGKFAFTSDDYDVFNICFGSDALEGAVVPDDHTRLVKLTVKSGVDAKSYTELAKAEKLKPMEVELKKLEDLAEAALQEFARMKQREAEHRDTNESTNQRLLHFSVFSMVCLFALAAIQVVYLKRYFKQKKLI